MSLEDFEKFLFNNKEKSSIKTIIRQIKVPEHVLLAWEDIRKSISVWGKVQENGERKWPSKYISFRMVDNWINSLPKEDKDGK